MLPKSLKYLILSVISISLLATSCEKKDTPDPISSMEYLYASQSEGSFYITTFGAIPETGSITSTFANAVTLVSGHLFLEKYGDYIYANSGAMGDGNGGEQTLRKYSLNEDGTLTEIATLTFANSPSVCEVVFASETKAYAISYKNGRLIIFNPSTMKETGSLDISSLAVPGAVFGDPTATVIDADGNPDGGNGIIVDGKLYLPLNQFNGGLLSYQALDVDGQIAIIDVATDKIEKVISTPDVQVIGMLGHTHPVVLGDYVYFCSGPISAMFGMKDGFVRVNKHTQEFDQGYHIAYSDLEGSEPGSYCMHASGVNGKLFFFLYKPSLRVNEDQQDFVNNKENVPYELDVNSKIGKMIGLPGSSSWAAQASLVKDDFVLFGLHATAGAGFYRYYPATGKYDVTPCVVTPAGAYKVIDLEK